MAGLPSHLIGWPAPGTRVFDVMRGLVGDFPAGECLDDIEGHVDSGRYPGRRDDYVAHDARIPHQRYRRVEGL